MNTLKNLISLICVASVLPTEALSELSICNESVETIEVIQDTTPEKFEELIKVFEYDKYTKCRDEESFPSMSLFVVWASTENGVKKMAYLLPDRFYR